MNTRYKIVVKNEAGEWSQRGCWGGENCNDLTIDDANADIEHLRDVYPDTDFDIEYIEFDK